VATGGAGGTGGTGASGGWGGNGGGGGGALEIFARGNVTVRGTILTQGDVGDGSVPVSGFEGQDGSLGLNLVGEQVSPGGLAGATGGHGGSGGQGSSGTSGGAGAGGTVAIYGSSVDITQASISVAGGNHNDGQLIVGYNIYPETQGTTTVTDGGIVITTSDTSSRPQYSGPTSTNPFVLNSPQTPLIAAVQNGAEAFGFLKGADGEAILNKISAPASAVAALYRVHDPKLDNLPAVPGYDYLFFANTGATGLGPARLGVNQDPVDLRMGGYTTDPAFNPGATGPYDLAYLASGGVYAVLVPRDSGSVVNASAVSNGSIIRAQQVPLGDANGQVAYLNVNTPPVAHDMTVNTTQNTPITFTVDATDADGDALRLNNTFLSVEGTAAFVPDQPLQITFTPPDDLLGSFTFRYQVLDALNASSST
jgi:hypothetical protein